jgi:hypothetical protein
MGARVWACSLAVFLSMIAATTSHASARLEKGIEYARVNGMSLRMDASTSSS